MAVHQSPNKAGAPAPNSRCSSLRYRNSVLLASAFLASPAADISYSPRHKAEAQERAFPSNKANGQTRARYSCAVLCGKEG